ncbi:hypothetical protein PHYSODRAFT_256009 [Phytophthora sojae]|uniref:HTH CENPB-type domain-containing protein n=1 Tax=Phytophthora sojae (strain P6497) TaxID=1094619 RepID=G5A7S6_PHYSP|nr:hypothetical protein PHYSODRAFT_256009 [Phytophthora sojae]EGZ07952.1 hypothetical protein PHYSODRAFT_256009 [Phytophthora sojae]|eukprot:XP_009536124.1 hypothetical protein PHYSODRAFT_256009 [Phytophthora sojae]
MATSKRKRGSGPGSGPRLNDLQRLEIIQRHRSMSAPVSLRQLARDFGVDEKTIRRVVAASNDIEARAASSAVLSNRGNVHRRPTPRFPQLEKALAAWIDARERARVDISPSIVIDKAKLVAREMGISPEDFKASWGWYDKFSKRYGLHSAFKTEEKGTLSSSSGNGRETQSLQELHRIMATYDPEWVFCVEESSLFYDSLPFAVSGGGGGGNGRKRVTMVLSCNSTGRVTLPICMVGREKWPTEARASFPVKYLMQDRAWLDRPTFGGWYSSVFVPFVRERTSKPVLLVVDGERPGHQGDFEDHGIRLVFLPPPVKSAQVIAAGSENVQLSNVDVKTWWSRPLQMGVVAALKAEYKYLLVQSALSYLNAPQEVKEALKAAEEKGDGNTSGAHFGHAPTLLDAARLLAQAWSQVPADLLENCFARANLVPPSKLLAAPMPPGASQLELVRLHSDSVATKIEEMLVSSCLPAQAWTGIGGQTQATNVKDRVGVFLLLDGDNSAVLQQQIQAEISEALTGSVHCLAVAPTTTNRS